MKKIIVLAFFWLCWGFVLGTFTLLFPLRYAIDYLRSQQSPAIAETIAAVLFIGAVAVIAFYMARITVRNLEESTSSKRLKTLHALLPVAAVGLAIYIMMTPSLHISNNERREITTQYTIGPYPVKEKIISLKKEGYTAIISLLHPAVAPFEPKLLAEEMTTAEKAGLDFINIPMLPWISKNEAAIDSLRQLVRTANGKYFIHCYLGKDRVNVAKRIIEQESKKPIAFEAGIKRRSIHDLKRFERGEIVMLAEGVYLSPLPTEEEFFGYVVATTFKHVVSLTDMREPEAKGQAENEEKALRMYKVPFHLFNLNDTDSDARMNEIIDSVRKLDKPIFIHAFSTNQPVFQRFKNMWPR